MKKAAYIIITAIIAFSFIVVSPAGRALGESVSIQTYKDCVCVENDPYQNHNGDSLAVGCLNHTSDHYVSLVYFDISSVPANAQITSATLNLYCQLDNNMADVRVYELAHSWTETTVTWDNMPYGDANGATSYFSVNGNGWHQVDVTAHVTAWHTENNRVTH